MKFVTARDCYRVIRRDRTRFWNKFVMTINHACSLSCAGGAVFLTGVIPAIGFGTADFMDGCGFAVGCVAGVCVTMGVGVGGPACQSGEGGVEARQGREAGRQGGGQGGVQAAERRHHLHQEDTGLYVSILYI